MQRFAKLFFLRRRNNGLTTVRHYSNIIILYEKLVVQFNYSSHNTKVDSIKDDIPFYNGP